MPNLTKLITNFVNRRKPPFSDESLSIDVGRWRRRLVGCQPGAGRPLTVSRLLRVDPGRRRWRPGVGADLP